MSKNRVLVFCAVCISIAACGGGDSSNNTRPPPVDLTPDPVGVELVPIITTDDIKVFGDLLVEVGKAHGFAITPQQNRQINSVQWQQISGPTLDFLASNSQTIGFDVTELGSYVLEVAVQLHNTSQPVTQRIEFEARSAISRATIRLDHTVTELGKVSLHVTGVEDKEIQSIAWQQLNGPSARNVRFDDDNQFIFFDAPSVTQDSVIKYQATIQYSDGSLGTDTSLVTVKNVEFNQTGLFFGNNDIITEDMHAYLKESPYRDALERCIYNNQIPNPPTCTFNDLPLLGMQTNSPTVDDVLNRTLVSHQWMGDRFKDFLTHSETGQDMLPLLRGVTAVVISYDIRPSFFWFATGAIYLDARNFWQSPIERDTLNDIPDFRTDFGSDLQFDMFWRYTKNDEYYPARNISKDERVSRSFENLEASISWLMYHELAHANDYFPPSSWSNISPSTTPLSYGRNNAQISNSLDAVYPLRSDIMHSLAQVRFANATPTALERNYRGTDVESFFAPDISPSFYSYFTIREDIATLFERYMMLYRLGAEADIAIIDGRTSGPDDEPLVVWGQRNRISDETLEDRAVYAVERLYPEIGNVRAILRSLNEPLLMTPNKGWFENIALNNPQPDNYVERLDRPRLSIEEKKRLEIKDQLYPHEHKHWYLLD